MPDYAETPPAGAKSTTIATASGPIALWDRPGGGRPLLLIHGNTSSKAAFAELFTAPGLIGRRLVAMDLPGCGESPDAKDPPATYTIPAFARAVGGVVSALGLAQPVALGWSMGGHVAIEAVGQGVDLGAMVLTGTPPCGPGGEEMAESFKPTEFMEVTFSENPSPAMLDVYVGQLYGTHRPIPEAFYAAARRCDGRMRRLFAEQWLSGLEGCHQRSVVAAWTKPIAVIQGLDEPFLDPALLDRLAWGNLWRGGSQNIPDAGHAPFFEQPEAYLGLLAAFLAEIG